MDLPPDNEIIRKSWNMYADRLNIQQFNAVWDDWCKKFSIYEKTKNSGYMNDLKQFIQNQTQKINNPNIIIVNDQTIKYNHLNSYQRRRMYELCDILGLHYEIKEGDGNFDKVLYVYRPDIWLWEFSEKNPHDKNPHIKNPRGNSKRQKIAAEIHRQNLEYDDKYNCEFLVGCIGYDEFRGFLADNQSESIF